MIFKITLTSLLVLYAIAVVYWIYTAFAGAPYYPSNKKAIKTITDFIKQELKSKNILELGSGDGRVANAIAKLNYKNTVTAIELSPFLTIIHRIKNIFKNIKNVNIQNGNIFKYDYSKYDLAITYLFPGLMTKLEKKLYKELKPGSFIISNTFKFKNYKPYKELNNKIVIYKV